MPAAEYKFHIAPSPAELREIVVYNMNEWYPVNGLVALPSGLLAQPVLKSSTTIPWPSALSYLIVAARSCAELIALVTNEISAPYMNQEPQLLGPFVVAADGLLVQPILLFG